MEFGDIPQEFFDAMGVEDESAQDDAPDTSEEETAVETDASSQADDEEGEIENPFEEGGQEEEAESETEEQVMEDRPNVNLKAEFDRKFEKLQRDMFAQQQAMMQTMQAMQASLLKQREPEAPKAPDPLEGLDPDDPDYEVNLLRAELDELKATLSAEKEAATKEKQQRSVREYQDWAANQMKDIVNRVTEGTDLANDMEAKRLLWNSAFTGMSSIAGDSTKINEIILAVKADRDAILKWRKPPPVVKARKTTRPSRKPISKRVSAPATSSGKKDKLPEWGTKEFDDAVSKALDALL